MRRQLTLRSQAIQDSRGGLCGLVGELEGFEYELPRPLRLAFAVEAGYGLVLPDAVSGPYEDLYAGSRVYFVAFPGTPAPRARAALPMPGPRSGRRNPRGGLNFADLGGDREVLQGSGRHPGRGPTARVSRRRRRRRGPSRRRPLHRGSPFSSRRLAATTCASWARSSGTGSPLRKRTLSRTSRALPTALPEACPCWL